MKLAILGTRGIPARYGGFETFAEQLSSGLVQRGHEVTVYCRSQYTSRQMRWYRGVRLVVLPTIRHKYLDTVAHTFLSTLHATKQGYDAVLVCNVANSVFLPLLRLFGIPVTINVDGLEWKRKKWSWVGKMWCRLSERLACRTANEIVTDAQVIQEYYMEAFRKDTVFIPYGANMQRAPSDHILKQFGLDRGKYLLYVSRFEPENNAHLVIESFIETDSKVPLVMVGDAPYAQTYIRNLRKLADPRVIFTGLQYGESYRELMSHAYCYVHATQVGGTHPALLDAMAMGNGILVSDTNENREVTGEETLYFSLSSPEDLAGKMQFVLSHPDELVTRATKARERVREIYAWDKVIDAYETLLESISKRRSIDPLLKQRKES